MPQIAAVVINDGAATPVATTFSPIGKDANGVFWFEQTTPSPTNVSTAFKFGYKQTRVLDAQKQLTGVSKVVYSLAIPVGETLGSSSSGYTPPPSVAYTVKCRIELDLPERSGYQERKNIRSFAFNLLQNAMAGFNVDVLQPSYS